MATNHVRRMDNHRVFRPEAVETYTTRRAGEPWGARLRFEVITMIVLTLLAVAAGIAVLLGGR